VLYGRYEIKSISVDLELSAYISHIYFRNLQNLDAVYRSTFLKNNIAYEFIKIIVLNNHVSANYAESKNAYDNLRKFINQITNNANNYVKIRTDILAKISIRANLMLTIYDLNNISSYVCVPKFNMFQLSY